MKKMRQKKKKGEERWMGERKVSLKFYRGARDQDKSQTRRGKEHALLYILQRFLKRKLKNKGTAGPESSVVASYCCILHGQSLFSPLTNQNHKDTGRFLPSRVQISCRHQAASYTWNIYIHHDLSIFDVAHFTNYIAFIRKIHLFVVFSTNSFIFNVSIFSHLFPI